MPNNLKNIGQLVPTLHGSLKGVKPQRMGAQIEVERSGIVPNSFPTQPAEALNTEVGTGINKIKDAEDYFTSRVYGPPQEFRGSAASTNPGTLIDFGLPVKHIRIKNREAAASGTSLYVSFVGEISAPASPDTGGGGVILIEGQEEREFFLMGVTQVWLIGSAACKYRVTYES